MSAKTRVRLLSLSSQSPGSVHSSPVTSHKKTPHQFSNSPVSSPMLSHVNDDQIEKKRRLQARLSDAAQKHVSSPASESRNKLKSTLSGWDNTQLTEHLHNCIQLSNDNKINVRNAFSLHLIDTMKDLVKMQRETNFQMAGSSIEAGAKIYASRVDAIHIQAYQVLDQVSQLDKDGDRGTMEHPDGDALNEDGTQAKRKTVKRKKKVIETDLRRINLSEVEQSYEVDPLLQKLSKEGDSSFGGRLLDALRCSHDSGGLMLDGLCETEPLQFQMPTDLISDREFVDLSLQDQVICPTFQQYEFNTSQQHPIFATLDSRDEELRFDPDREIPAGGDDYQADACSDGEDFMDAQATDGGDKSADFVDYISKSSNALTTLLTAGDSSYNSLLSLVTGKGGDYSFFSGIKNMWAGPQHWMKKKRVATGGEGNKAKRSNVTREAYVVDFDADVDFKKKLKKTRAAIAVSQAALERYETLRPDLPEDLHYKGQDFLHLFLKPLAFVVTDKQSETITPDEADKSAYDYENKKDVDNFCPDMYDTLGDDNDDYQGSPCTQQTITEFDDTLIAQPNLVQRIDLLYAKRPKKVDFRRLKRNMWNILTDAGDGKENVEAASKSKPNGMPFTQLYSLLPGLCPSHEAKDLSPAIAFVALLHMCNEKNLLLKSTDSTFSDLTIHEGEK